VRQPLSESRLGQPAANRHTPFLLLTSPPESLESRLIGCALPSFDSLFESEIDFENRFSREYSTTTKSTLWKRLVTGLSVIVLLWLLACGALYQIMRQPPEMFGRFMARIPGPVAFLVLPFETLWMHARAGDLHIGDPAPDFSLMKLDGSASVRLSSLTATGQPVVLIFGSYT